MANLLYYKKFNPIGFSKPITDIFLQEDAFNHILIRLIGEQDAFLRPKKLACSCDHAALVLQRIDLALLPEESR
jgi:hypothetical protein